MELEKEKYSTKDSLWGIVINVNKKYIKLNNYIIFSPFFFITQVHFHAYIECFWTLHHYLIQVYVILLIHYHLTSCLFVCLFSLFLSPFCFCFSFFVVAASSASILWKNEIIKFPFFFFPFVMMWVVRIIPKCLVASLLKFVHLSIYLPVLPTPCFIFVKSLSLAGGV